MNKESGGTIIGLIIGLVVGLAIAVVVAVMITKTSSPFTNKLGMTKPAEVPDIQLTDPNKPLYGNSYKEAPPRPAPDTASDDNNASEDTPKASDENPDRYADTTENTPEVAKNTDDSKANKSPTNVIAKKPVEEKAALYLQVGAFRAPSDAESTRAKLALIGVEATVSGKNSEDSLYRVRIGPFSSMDEMNRMRSKLVENSIDVAVIKTPK